MELRDMSPQQLLDHVESLARMAPAPKSSAKPFRPLSEVERRLLADVQAQIRTSEVVDRNATAERFDLTRNQLAAKLYLFTRRGFLERRRGGSPRKAARREADESHPLVQEHLDLVPAVAEGFLRGNRRHRELIHQAGQDGLVRAAQLYEPRPNASFRTYARYFVRGYIINALSRRAALEKREQSAHAPAFKDAEDELIDFFGKEQVFDQLAIQRKVRKAAGLLIDLHRKGVLSERHVLGFMLREMHQLHYAGISSVLGVSTKPGDWIKTLQRAKNRIRKHLSASGR